jgi:hypothetical protein
MGIAVRQRCASIGKSRRAAQPEHRAMRNAQCVYWGRAVACTPVSFCLVVAVLVFTFINQGKKEYVRNYANINDN